MSAGNHAIAVAWAARTLGTSAKVVMPKVADPYRVARCAALGAEVVLAEDVHAAFALTERIERDEGRAFVTDFGQKAFRRPLNDAESTAFYGVYVAGKEGATHAAGLKAVIQMALQSPQFLYRAEKACRRRARPCGVRPRAKWRRACRTCCGARCRTHACEMSPRRTSSKRRSR